MMQDPLAKQAEALADAMRTKGFHVAPDMTVSSPDLGAFKCWTKTQLKRWRNEGKLPKADPVSKPCRYSLYTVAAFLRDGDFF